VNIAGSRRTVFLVFFALVLAGIAITLIAALSDSGGGGSKSPLLPSTETVAARVARLRGLTFDQIPKVVTVSEGELSTHAKRVKRRALARLRSKHPSELERVRRLREATSELLKLTGLVGASFQAKQVVATAPERVAGLYATSRNRVVLVERPGETRDQLEGALAHELDHALEAHHFDVFRGKPKPSQAEVAAARQALIEGSATLLELRYAHRYLGQAQPVAPTGNRLLGPENFAEGLPPALAAEFRFPYTSGTSFVRTLYRTGGWRLVNRAFRDPPTTTADILHPGRWRPGRPEPRLRFDLGSALPREWRRIGAADTGELDALVLVALGASGAQARQAAAGWDGGWFEVWRRKPTARACEPPCRKDNVGAIGYRWKTRADAGQFARAAAVYLNLGVFAKERPQLTWRYGDGYAALSFVGRGAALAYAPSAKLAHRLAANVASAAVG
jgi:hypothetical protein